MRLERGCSVDHLILYKCELAKTRNMSTYKLTYFPVHARAELARFVFAQAGVKYEDVRIPKEKWAELKPCKQMALQG